MNKNHLIFGIGVLLICIGLSGCSEVINHYPSEESRFIGKWRAIQFPIGYNQSLNVTWTFIDNNTLFIYYNWEHLGFNNSTGSRWGYELIGNKLRITNYHIPFNYSQEYDYKFSSDYNTLTLGDFSNNIIYKYKRIE